MIWIQMNLKIDFVDDSRNVLQKKESYSMKTP